MSQGAKKSSYRDFLAQGRIDDAIAALELAAANNPTAAAFCDLGVVYGLAGDGDRAVQSFEKAMQADPRSALARARLAETLAMNGYMMQAIEYMGQATDLEPANAEYKQKFLALVSFGAQKKFNPLLKKKILECFETPGVDLTETGFIWYQMLKIDPGFREIYKAGLKANYDGFIKTLARLNSNERAGLADPFFLTGLRSVTVYDTGFEAFLTYLRRMLLEGVHGGNQILPPERSLPLAAALAHYCFFVEYILPVEPAEQAMVDMLTRAVEQSATPGAAALAVLACYRPLGTLANAAQIAAGDLLDDAALVKLQIADGQAQAELRAGIEAITPVSDEVSLKVQAQYEAFPYPRWRYYSPFLKEPGIEGRLTDAAPRILVAGCGTGREAIELAACFPDGQVLAVDLSLASLAYARHRAQELGVANIRFAQADLQELPDTLGPFDYIASSGVLHHMKDPMKGWRVLAGLLKPGGLMRVGLYSGTARRYITAARKIIAQTGLGDDAPSIRAFRAEAQAVLPREIYDNLRIYWDYYTTSDCRDLLFHVQEHHFDLPQVEEALRVLGLKFERFYLPHAVTFEYFRAFPDDPAAVSLGNWAKFEAQNPNLFSAMYRFWCSKPASQA